MNALFKFIFLVLLVLQNFSFSLDNPRDNYIMVYVYNTPEGGGLPTSAHLILLKSGLNGEVIVGDDGEVTVDDPNNYSEGPVKGWLIDGVLTYELPLRSGGSYPQRWNNVYKWKAQKD